MVENILASIPEAVRMLSVGRSTLYRLISDGKLETVKIGRRTLIRVDSIKALAAQGNVSA
jgi:excisionase family DNA binding protein